MTTKEAATKWIDTAIEIGMDPQVVIQPDGSEGVLNRHSRKGRPGPLTDDLIGDVIEVLISRGRIHDFRADSD